MAQLQLLTGATPGQHVPLQGDRIVLGRDSTCDFSINEEMLRPGGSATRTDNISRRHALIVCVNGQYYIEDGNGRGRKSRNGTFVNDQRIPFPERVPLRHNDRIRICDFECVFREGPDTDSSIEASISHDSSEHNLQAQPAEKLRIILEINNRLSRTLDLDFLLPQIVEHLLELFQQADRGFIILLDVPSGRLVCRAFKTRRANDPDRRFSDSIVRQCLEKVEAILGNDLVRQFPESQSVTDLPMRRLMCAPLWAQDGRALGAIQLDTRSHKQKFNKEDLDLLLGVASQASIAVCNARLYRDSLLHQQRERDLELAHQVQQMLLPQCLPELPGYAFHAYYESAQEVGGDYYDFIPLPQQRLAVLLGDVTGKGVAAALVMAKFSVEARVCLQTEPEPAVAVSKLNTIMNRAGLTDRFVTLVAVVLDPATHTATLVNAGHPLPLLTCRATGTVAEAMPTDVVGTPLGVVDDCRYASWQVPLHPGDGLVLFSDGVTDAMDAGEQRFKTERVRAVAGSDPFAARETGERLIRTVKQHAAGCSQNDDMTLVCFGRAGE